MTVLGRWVGWCLVLGVVLWVGPTVAQVERPVGIIPHDATPAPALRLSDMDGQEYDLGASRGRWVFVHFWATWCVPCRYEIPAIQRMAERLQGTPLEIVLVNTAETEDQVFSFLGAVAPDLLGTLMDRDGAVTARWQPRGLPTTFLVDPDGIVRFVALGDRPWDTEPYLEFLEGLTRTSVPEGAAEAGS